MYVGIKYPKGESFAAAYDKFLANNLESPHVVYASRANEYDQSLDKWLIHLFHNVLAVYT